jgi:hypothetical protein
MKFDFKIDFIARTASHYTTVGLTPYSEATVQKNQTYFLNVAERAKNDTAAQATEKLRASIKPGKIDLMV